MLLVEDGKLGLDDPLTNFFSWVPKEWGEVKVGQSKNVFLLLAWGPWESRCDGFPQSTVKLSAVAISGCDFEL